MNNKYDSGPYGDDIVRIDDVATPITYSNSLNSFTSQETLNKNYDHAFDISNLFSFSFFEKFQILRVDAIVNIQL